MMLLDVPVSVPMTIDNSIPTWQIICLIVGGIWAILKMYFRQQTQEREITLMQAKMTAVQEEAAKATKELDEKCGKALDEHKKERREELRVISESNKALNEMTIRMDESMKHMTEAVEKLTYSVDSIRGNGRSST